MEHYRRTAHTRFDIKLHLVWITKYRKKLLRGDFGLRMEYIRTQEESKADDDFQVNESD